MRRSNRKLWLADVIRREGTSESDIARGIKSHRYPKPHYSETGRRFWWEWEWDANDKRIAALKLGPKIRPPAPTLITQRKAIASRRNRQQAKTEHAETDASI